MNSNEEDILFGTILVVGFILMVVIITYITRPIELTKLDNGKCLVKQPFLYNGVTHKGDITLNYSESISVRDCKNK